MNVRIDRDGKFAAAPAGGRTTGELLRLLEGSADIKRAVEEIDGDLSEKTFSQRLKALMEKRGVETSWVVERSGMSKAFIYQLCSGTRGPGRDIVLRLSLLLGAGIQETQRMLRSAGRGALYPRVRRDAVILYALKEGMGVAETDEMLLELGEEALVKNEKGV